MSKENAAGAAPQENKMGVLPVGRLLAGMAVPMMISMLVQALYNIVDSVFVSRLSENAFNAVGLAFPLQSLMIAVGAGTAVGTNALLAQPLAGLFSLSATTHTMCVDCMRIVSLGFLFAGLCIAFQGVFQALECGVESLIISLCRQVLFVLPPVWLLTRIVTGPENVSLVWWPLALGEVVTLMVALVL